MSPRQRKARPGPLWTHPSAEVLPTDQPGPFARLSGGRLLTVDDRQVLTSRDRGRTWTPRPLLEYGRSEKEYKISRERVLLSTASGTLVLAFVNLNERVWLWRDELHDALPGTRLPCCTVRSTDNGRTWQDLTVLHQEWTGELRDLIQLRSGRLVLSVQKLLHHPGRHGVLTYQSDDDGATWTASNLIDLGGCGHHGGVCEAAITELADGRMWMLLRTNWGRFWQAFSGDGGSSWRELGPSRIAASSAPGLLRRLRSGRLLLCWNRPFPEGRRSFPLTGGDGLWSEVPVSNHRGELSVAFSEDDGATFTDPVVVARQPGASLSYPRVLEMKAGQLWLTTMQGELRLQLNERDFV